MNLYLAAPLFTAAERAFNEALAEALEADGHRVYLPQRDAPEATGPGRTTALFRANLRAIQGAEAVVAVCDGPQVDDGVAWEVGYAWGRNIRVYGLRTDARLTQQPDEPVNLMILECLACLVPTVESLRAALRATAPG